MNFLQESPRFPNPKTPIPVLLDAKTLYACLSRRARFENLFHYVTSGSNTYSRHELFWRWTIVFGVSGMFQLTVSCSDKLGFKWRLNTRKYIVSVYPKWIHILCASIHVCFTSRSIHQCWAVLSLPKQEPAGQGQVYRPLTGGSYKQRAGFEL